MELSPLRGRRRLRRRRNLLQCTEQEQKPETQSRAPQTAPSPFPQPPALATEADGLRLWHKMDAAFRVPRATACFLLALPDAYTSPRAAALTHLAVKLLEVGMT